MRTTEGATWSIQSDLPYHVNFACWLRQRWAVDTPFPEEAWRGWLHALARENPIHDAIIVRLASDPALNDLAARHWYPFVREFNMARPALSQRLQQALTAAQLEQVMQGAERHLTFWHTSYPGDLCLQAGQVWVLGDGFMEPEPLRGLVVRLLTS